jgi:8-oxo-dGTP pyrophosphatase MutT (NUDIX family)
MMQLGACVAIFQAGRLLLTQREDFEVWCLPGGHVEPGESLAQAAVREAREETGLEVELTRLVGMYYRLTGWSEGGVHVASFSARVAGGSLNPQPDEVLDARFFDPERLPEPLFWNHTQRIRDALDERASGLVRTQHLHWPFDGARSRQEVYDLRDRSGLSRQAFYRKHFGDSEVEDGHPEVGPQIT